jgi:hypothetical protein
MSGSITSQWVMPIVIAAALTFWISIVLYAHRHPAWKHHPPPPRTEVAGGAFQAVDGGRQLEPIPGESVHEIIPTQRAAWAEDSYETADPGATTAADPGATSEAGPEGPAHLVDQRGRAGIGLPPR